MRKTRGRLAIALAGLAAAAVLEMGEPVVAKPAGGAAGVPGTAAVTVTGDQVTVLPGETRRGSVRPAAERGLGRVLLNLGIGGRAHLVPAAAVPYLGRGLDPSLFDVEMLTRHTADGRVPVRVSHRGERPAPPGVTVTGSAAGTAEGYLTAASARDFGAALVAQFLADRAAGGFGERGIFAGGVTISAPWAEDPPVRPQYEMHTLTIGGTDADGRPAEGDPVFVYNVDDSSRFGSHPWDAIGYFADGTAKFSVPAGRYHALSLFLATDAAGEVTGLRLVSRPEFDVTGDRTVTTPAREADSQVTMVTPRPAVPQEGGFVLQRAARSGPALYLGLQTGPGVPVWVAPTDRPVTAGTLHTFPYQRLTAPPSAPGIPYEYQLQYASSGVIPRQRYVVRPDSLATVDAHYYSEVSSTGIRQTMGVYPFETGLIFRGEHRVELPRHQVEYISGDPAVLWIGGMAKYFREFPSGDGVFYAWHGAQRDTARTYSPGQRLRADFNRFPLHPAGQVHQLGLDDDRGLTVPAVTRAGDLVRIMLAPFSDNQPGHVGQGFNGEQTDTIAGHYEIYRDGVLLDEGDRTRGDPWFRQAVTLAADPATVRLVLDATREGPMYKLATRTHTEWTWRSAHQQGGTLPTGLVCDTAGEEPDRACAVEPLLTVRYAVGGLRESGTARPGTQTLDLAVGHLQHSRAARITAATVQFSTDDGATWQDARVTGLGGGIFRAHYAATGTGPSPTVSLRVTASDAAGGQISETVHRAYALAS